MEQTPLLLVDQDDDLRSILQELLQSAGFNVIPEKKLESAFTTIRQKPDIKFALVEIENSESLNLSLIREFRQKFPWVITIGMTIGDSHETAGMVESCSLQGIVYKPFHLEEVLRILFPGSRH